MNALKASSVVLICLGIGMALGASLFYLQQTYVTQTTASSTDTATSPTPS